MQSRDIYWRGEGAPKLHHEKNYEMHFGPLWYAFEHKGSWFIVLFSDEGDPNSGEKSFNEPELQGSQGQAAPANLGFAGTGSARESGSSSGESL